MLHPIRPSKGSVDKSRYLPPVVTPLITAAEQGADLVPVVSSITSSFGFDSFMYGLSTSPKPDHESCMYVFTTLPKEWVIRYDQMAYIEVDPRILLSWDNPLPLVWDQSTVRTTERRTLAFLEDASNHAISSGVCFPFRFETETRAIVSLNSAIPYLDEPRRNAIARNLGDMMVFGHYFHELFMKSVVARGVPPRVIGMPLSPREKQCLTLAAHGLTSEDIALKLGIVERTVQFHFDSIRSKLSAANRQEAIAKAISQGMIAI